MRKKSLFLLPLCIAAAAVVWAAAAGNAADPLASLSYLRGVFTDKVDAAVNARLDSSDAFLFDSAGTVSGDPFEAG